MTSAATISLFRDVWAKEVALIHVDLDDLAETIRGTAAPTKTALPLLKLARFGKTAIPHTGSLRHDANLVACTGVEGDYDAGLVSFDEAVERLLKANIRAIVWTTPSHTPEKPRWRVVAPFSDELHPNGRAHMADRLNGALGGILATESWTLSQSYFYGRVEGAEGFRIEIVDGEFIDLLDDLDMIAIGKPNGAALGNGAINGHAAGSFDEAAVTNAIVTGSAYHESCTRLLGKWAHAGVPFLDAEARLFALFDQVDPALRDARWVERRGDVPRTVQGIYGKDARKRDAGEASRFGDDTSLPWQTIFNAGENDPIEPRQWLLGKVFCRRFLSALMGDGGVGKTALRLLQYMALATGRSLTGEHVHHRTRVLLVCLEDDLDEVRRRIRAVRFHYKISLSEIDGWLYVITPSGLKLLKEGNDGELISGNLDKLVRNLIMEHDIGLVAFDPFVKSHGVDENSNNAIDQVCIILTKIAAELNCAVDVLHHTRKGAFEPGNADAGRGASALKDGARLVRTINKMSSDEAKDFGVQEGDRQLYVRVDNGKINLAPPAAKAQWFKLIGVPLHNGNALYPDGDEVQTVEAWCPPSTWDGLDHATLNRILDDIEAGMPNGSRYSESNAAKDRAAWLVVQRHAPDKSDVQCRDVIKTWVKNGVLFTEEYRDPVQRRDIPGLHVNAAKRPS